MQVDRRTFLALPVVSVVVPVAQAMMSPAAEAAPHHIPTPVDFKTALPAPGTFPPKWICGS